MLALEVQPFAAFALAFGAVLVLTPLAIRIANRFRFWDQPEGYKAHAAPTPYLGGAVLVVGFLIGAVTLGGGLYGYAPVLAGMLVLAVVGSLDDWRTVPPRHRLSVEALAAVFLWATDLGWHASESELVNLALTIAWVVALVNAFNLMDNMDGAASTVAAVSCGGTAALAFVAGEPQTATFAVALGGACVGFLRYNLAGPARIFLGDGGSMPIGFVVAATLMMLPAAGPADWTILVSATFIAGLPFIDTCLVLVSRRRRGVAIYKGGRDHTTHRLRTGLPSTRAVAAVLALTQALLCAAGIFAFDTSPANALAGGALFAVTAVVAVVLLEKPRWLSAAFQTRTRRSSSHPHLGMTPSGPAVSSMLVASSGASMEEERSAD